MEVIQEKVAIVIPTLNEAENIPQLVERLRNALETLTLNYELIVVDDDSTDGTADVVQALSAEDPRIRLLVRKGQRGLAGAVIYGWKHTDAAFLGVIDADLQHPPEILPQLLEAVQGGKDIAIASRYTSGNHDSVADWNPVRAFISRCTTALTTPLQRKGLRVKDPMSGYFIVRRECIEGLNLQPQGFKILLEILVKGRMRNAAEVPYRFGLRNAGNSKADFKVALDYLSLLGKLSRYAVFRPQQ
ncbi:MAG: polyprenol monophosphomannose synthase [Acidobacteriaceae bacterium]|nr:polyprenol monophosphomannose synthase [Acidobacteriaceae bacterium]